MHSRRHALLLCACALMAPTVVACSDDTSAGTCPPTAVPQLCVPAGKQCCPDVVRDYDRPQCTNQVWTCKIGRVLGRCDEGPLSLPSCLIDPDLGSPAPDQNRPRG